MAIMIDLAPGLRAIPGRPAHAFNVHLVGGVIVDAGTRHAARRILRAVRRADVPVHRGSSPARASARPVRVGPMLLANLDQLKRRRFLKEWQSALGDQ